MSERFKPLPTAIKEAILADLASGMGIRETSRHNHVGVATVGRVRKASLHEVVDDAAEHRTEETEVGSGPVDEKNAVPRDPAEQAAFLEETKRELAYQRARNERLMNELSQLRAVTETGGVVGESVAGRVAMADFRRRTWESLAQAVERLPHTLREEGWDGVRTLGLAELLPDLYTLTLSRPYTRTEAEMRRYLEHMVRDPSKFAVMVRDTAEGSAMRHLFLEGAATYIYRPAVSKLFDRSIEMPPMGPPEAYG